MAYLTTDELNAYRCAARLMISSGLVDYISEEKAVTLMLLNRSRGCDPLSALTDYYIINDKPALKADAMLERFYAGGGVVDWNTDSTDNERQTATFHYKNMQFTSEWNIERATIAGINTTVGWQTHPAQMLRARVISEGIRAICPEINKGLYTPEEVACFNNKAPAPKEPAPSVQTELPIENAPKVEPPKEEPKPSPIQKLKRAAAKASKRPAPAPVVTGPQDEEKLKAEIMEALHCGVDWYSIVNTINTKYGVGGELPSYVRSALVACAPKG